MSRRFVSYNPNHPGTAADIRKLHFEINSVEEVYQEAIQTLTNLLTSEFPLSFGVKFYEMHARVEKLLLKLLNFFHIVVNPRPLPTTTATTPNKNNNPNETHQGRTHRFHIAILEAFTKPDNPLHPHLGDKATQDVLRAWRLWRNKWAKKSSIDEMQHESNMRNLRRARADMPLVMEKLRVAVSFTNALARAGAQVVQCLDDEDGSWGWSVKRKERKKGGGRGGGVVADKEQDVPEVKSEREFYPWMSVLAHRDNH